MGHGKKWKSLALVAEVSKKMSRPARKLWEK
jgi:hypothetical protein